MKFFNAKTKSVRPVLFCCAETRPSSKGMNMSESLLIWPHISWVTIMYVIYSHVYNNLCGFEQWLIASFCLQKGIFIEIVHKWVSIPQTHVTSLAEWETKLIIWIIGIVHLVGLWISFHLLNFTCNVLVYPVSFIKLLHFW